MIQLVRSRNSYRQKRMSGSISTFHVSIHGQGSNGKTGVALDRVEVPGRERPLNEGRGPRKKENRSRG